jgi:N-methylhydantoinase A
MTYRIGVDVGGTFTDVVCVAADGTTTLAKAASTPADQSEGVVAGLAVLAETLGVTLPDLLRQTERIVHGTTVATNALLERKGAKIAMLTTEGHRDVIEMREGLKPERYNMRLAAAPALVPRRLRFSVRERLRPDGRVEVSLDQASLDAAIAQLRAGVRDPLPWWGGAGGRSGAAGGGHGFVRPGWGRCGGRGLG